MRDVPKPKDTYKVGFTTVGAAARAKSMKTAALLDEMHVLREWSVYDPKAVEREVHRRLAPFRITSSREWFRIRFDELQTVVEAVISNLKAEAPPQN